MTRPIVSPVDAIVAQHGDVQVLPTSFAQQRFWMLDQIDGAGAYTLPVALRLRGTLDVAALRVALQLIVDRHEALRTVFAMDGDEPVQVVLPCVVLGFAVEDVATLPADARESFVHERVTANANASFDLGTGPLLRASLLRLGTDEHVLLLAVHHVVADGWSIGVLFDELRVAYTALKDGRDPALPPLPLQYADYAVWQRRVVGGTKGQGQLAYWTERLRHVSPLEIETDRARPPEQTANGGKREMFITRAVVDGVRSLARTERATPYMAFLAAYFVLLHRYSAQTDLVVGSITSGRLRPEVEPLIGLFVNTLAIRADVMGGQSFVELLRTVRDRATEAYANQDVPFEQVVDAVQPTRDRSRSPLFQAAFQLLEGLGSELTLPGLVVTRMRGVKDTTKFELTLMLHPSDDGGLRAVIEYNSDLFDAATVDRMLEHYSVLLGGIVSEPTSTVALLPLMSDAERRQILQERNATAVEVPDALLHELIFEQCDRTPERVAVEADGEHGADATRTFAELASEARGLASRLRSRGVRRGDAVGIALDRSCELIVAIVGTLAAGAHYVPLDLDLPSERLGMMVDESRPSVIVTSTRDIGRVRDFSATATLVAIDTERDEKPGEGRDLQGERGSSADLAYTIYTSGSTGRPKGVMIPHRAVVNYVCWMRGTYPVTADDAVLQKAPVSFDASIWELFLPLVTGARLVLARPGGHKDAVYLADVVRRRRVTLLQLVPSQLAMMLEEGSLAACTQLRRIICGGEALPVALLESLMRVVPDVAVTNLYGPTETTVYSTHWDLDRATFDGSVPIGRPIWNTSVYVVDAARQPVPTGVPGELLIGGRGVAVGYAGRADLTRERFIPLELADGAVVYRTGDRVRWRPDGMLQYLGRADTQVKLRGHRIELDEIEWSLTQDPTVSAAAAIVREDAPGDRRLVAYVTPAGADVPNPVVLGDVVRARLPDYMVPVAIVVLDALPLSANGKLDRRALPAPDASASGSAEIVLPRTPLEEEIAAVWRDVLGRDVVGVTDDFFALGGHSLLAMRVVARLAATTPVRLTIGTLFEARTVERLASYVEVRLTEAPSAHANAIPSRSPGEPAPLTFAQELLWIREQMTPGRAAYNVPVVRRVRGTLDVVRLQRAFDAVVARHSSLRTVFVEEGGVVRQTPQEAMPIPIEVIDFTGTPPECRLDAARCSLRDRAAVPFDLVRGPVVRVVLAELGEDDALLMFVFHHLVFDGGSIRVLFRDLDRAYTATGTAAPMALSLQQLPVQLADVAAWERGTAMDASDEGMRFWREQLADAVLRVDLPTDSVRRNVLSGPVARTAVTLPRSLRDAVRRTGRETGTTPFMVLLTAVQTLLARYTGRDDILIGSPVARRARPETQEIIGHLARTVPIRVKLHGNPTFAEALSRTREACVGAFRHQDAPYEPLVAALSRGADGATFEVLFVLQDPEPAHNQLGTASLESIGVAAGDARADLVISAAETADGLRVVAEYREDLFAEATVARLLSHLGTLVVAATGDRSVAIAKLPLMDGSERTRVISDFNATGRDYGPPATLVDLLDAQARRTPAAIAVVDADESITYAALHERAAVLATLLGTRGIGPNSLVAVVAERSVAMVVAILGVVMSGAAYVPVDPDYPSERVRFMLEDSAASVVVTQRHLVERIPIRSGRSVVEIDAIAAGPSVDDGSSNARASAPALGIRPTAADPAYMIYTSGSTGRPKGALNGHGAIVNRLQWMQEAYGLTADDVILQKTPASFDVSVWEFFWPLVSGARLVMAPPGDHRDPRAVAGLLARYGVTVCHFVPSMLRAFVAEPSASSCTSLRDVMASGEALAADLVASFYRALPGVRLHNLYGPTECAIDVSAWPCPSDLDAAATVPIGRPIANTRLYVLDSLMQPAPIGVPGELYIGGVQVGLGYHDRPELTAARFVADPFSRRPGQRLYRTGDVARWRDDGTIEYLGRSDDQVKLRGFRIELGELEAAVGDFPGVQRAVAAVQTDAAGVQSLNAFVVERPGEPVDRSALAEWLRGRLPAHMVPAHVVPIAEIPISPSGKVDRRALPVPSGTDLLDGAEFVSPRTPVEAVVALIFADVAGCPAVGAETSFFDIGGHSLLAARVLTFASRLFHQPLTLRMLFRAPTVAAFAAAIIEVDAVAGRAMRIAELFLASRSAAPPDSAVLAGAAATQEPT